VRLEITPVDGLIDEQHGSAQTTVRRAWARGPRPERVDGKGWALQIYRPASIDPADDPSPAVMLVPGTTGPGTLSAIAALLASHGYIAAGDDVELDYPGAGHFFRPPATPSTVNRNDSLVAGGAPAESAQAQRDAWTRTLAFLKASLG
jgi:hypothetical protein